MLIYDIEGNLADANGSALKIIGIHDKEDLSAFNLFDNHIITLENERLHEKGLFKFQTQLDFENSTNHHNTGESKDVLIEGTVSVIDSGFLVQIQRIPLDRKSEKLFESEEKYRRFFDDDLTGDFIATPEGKVIECNPAFAEIYGFNNRENASKTDISDFNPEDWEILIKRLEAEHKIKDHQTTHLRRDGKQIHVVSNVVAVFNENKEIDHVKGFIFDDTERKEAEEALMKSEEKYRRLFDEDLTGDFIATLEGKILECNPSFAHIYGFKNCEMALKWNISQSNPFDWPYMVTRLKNEGKIQGFQSWQRRSDTMRIHVVANMVGIFDESDELIQVKGYVFDDTERKQAEEELNRGKNQITSILDSIKDGFIALNNFWVIIYVNRCAADYAGVDVDDLIGQNLWQRFPELVGTVYETSFRRAMNEKEIKHFKARGISKTSQCFDLSVYPSDEGISVFWRDITQLRRMGEELK